MGMVPLAPLCAIYAQSACDSQVITVYYYITKAKSKGI